MKWIPILLEVLDKEPDILTIWAIFFIIGLIGFSVSYFRWQFVVLAILTPIVPAFLLLSEFYESDIYSSIWAEEPTYFPQIYLAIASSFLLPIAGAILNLRKQNFLFR